MKLLRNADGSLAPASIQSIEEALTAITDQFGSLMDLVLQKGFIPVFRCCHSGLLLPGDYVKQWGRLYGIGYGPNPISEVLDTDYEGKLPEITPEIQSIDQIMHPVGVCGSQVDFLMVNPTPELNYAILEKDDPKMKSRSAIIREKQLVNPRGRLKLMHAKFKGAF